MAVQEQESLVRLLDCLITKSHLTIEMDRAILVSMCTLSSGISNDSGIKSSKYEQLTALIMDVFLKLLSSPHDSVTLSLMNAQSQKYLMARIIALLLDVLVMSSMLEARLGACKSLNAISENLELETLALMLPGLLSSLIQVLTGKSERTHSLLLSNSLDLLHLILSRIFADTLYPAVAQDQVSWDALKVKNAFSRDSSLPMKPRSIEWLKDIDQKVLNLMNFITGLSTHSHGRVRLSLVNLSKSICTKSSQTLHSSVQPAIEILLLAANDSFPIVSATASEFLVELKPNLSKKAKGHLVSRFHELIAKLPMQLRSSSLDHVKVSSVRLIRGYLETFHHILESTLTTFAMQEYQMDLLRALEMDTSNVKIVEDQGVATQLTQIAGGSFQETPMNLTQLIAKEASFKNFHRDSIAIELAKLFETLARHGSTVQLSSFSNSLIHLLDPRSIHSFQPQSLWILSSLIQGLQVVEPETQMSKDKKRLIRSIFKELIAFNYQQLATNASDSALQLELKKTDVFDHLYTRRAPGSFNLSKTDTQANRLSIQEYHHNILQIDFFMVTLARMSSVLKKDFEPYLIDALYPLLERLGDPNRSVSSTAWTCLDVIANNVNATEPTVAQLIMTNVDYIVNSVSQRLRFLKSNPRAPKVLAASIRIAGPKIMEFMEDSVLEILDLLDNYHNVNESVVGSLYEVFDAIIAVLAKESASICAPDSLSTIELRIPQEFGNASPLMVQFFLKNQDVSGSEEHTEKTATREQIKSFFTLNQSESKTPHPDIENDEEPLTPKEDDQPLTKSASFTLQILSKSSLFLSVISPELRAYILRIVKTGIPLLQDVTKERDPLIHRLWSSVLSRLNDPEPFVVLEALGVVGAICRISPEFVFKRVSDDLIPKALQVLNHIHQAFSKYASGNLSDLYVIVHGHQKTKSHKFKNYLNAIQALETILMPMKLCLKDTVDLTKALIPFMLDRFPKEAQEGACRILRGLMDKDHGDGVWLDIWMAIGGRSLVPTVNVSGARTLNVPIWVTTKDADHYTNAARSLMAAGLPDNWTEFSLPTGSWKKSCTKMSV